MVESEVALFERIANLAPPENAPALFDTSVVVGGSLAGLFAARVLADHARQVIVLEPDELGAGPRRGVPQGTQFHLLLAAARLWLDRWFPGFTRHAEELGATLAPTSTTQFTVDGRRQIAGDSPPVLMLSRPFLEARVREYVLALPNVSLVPGRATGLEYRDFQVSAVRYTGGDTTHVLPAGFVVGGAGQRRNRVRDY
jgi:2-polyprenyl-6-methoxyphenol hydroxylase-like FAD-dependent oxidoreductase